ncbi:biotin carboxylase N-terminal domain-containing protein [Bradyrhizobium brasilense]|uniref:biotin carboxylase N-terminal domain-containing protein n=1 Tax=Bradyrhizobium brasilense TaxID=1419277 RepID=UPI001E4D17E6|nr:biotin carboxylase N-terminal domain-containing protein [Bradyrhizobium brasilense]
MTSPGASRARTPISACSGCNRRGPAMFRKILIANRGEIACRIARTCQRLGVAVSTVHSTADADALHVKAIGESIGIGGAPASESYLRIDAVIAAAKTTGAEAIHPGFGFLAENTDFARAVEAAGLVFIGPTPETIERLGDKASAKREAVAAGVPTVPGSDAPSEDRLEVERIVRRLELPVMLKAAPAAVARVCGRSRPTTGLATKSSPRCARPGMPSVTPGSSSRS